MIRKLFTRTGSSLDKVIDKTPDAQTAFLPLQALICYIIGIGVFMSGPQYVIGGLVMFGLGTIGMLSFIGIIGERFLLLFIICECIGLAASGADIIFVIQHGFSALIVLFAAFGLWYMTFGTVGIVLPDEAADNWRLLGIAHIILVPGMGFVGAFTSPSDNWITLPLPFITIALTGAFITRCVFQHQSKKKA